MRAKYTIELQSSVIFINIQTMKTQKYNRKKLYHFTTSKLQDNYLNLLSGGERKATTKADEDIE